MAPYIFIVPGVFEGTEPFIPLENALKAKGYDRVFTSPIASLGTNSLTEPYLTVTDDIAGIHRELERVVEEAGDDGVVMIAHSAGGFMGPGALEGLSAKALKEAGKTGGVHKVIYFTAGCVVEGTSNLIPGWGHLDVS